MTDDETAKKFFNSHLKILKNDSFSSIPKNNKQFNLKKVITFESAFNKNNKTIANTMIKPLILPSNIKLNEISGNMPINININNYNINNFHISKNDIRNDNSTFNFNKKNMQNDVFNNFLDNNGSLENNHMNFINKGYNSNTNKVNISNSSIKNRQSSRFFFKFR